MCDAYTPFTICLQWYLSHPRTLRCSGNTNISSRHTVNCLSITYIFNAWYLFVFSISIIYIYMHREMIIYSCTLSIGLLISTTLMLWRSRKKETNWPSILTTFIHSQTITMNVNICSNLPNNRRSNTTTLRKRWQNPVPRRGV